MNLFLITDFGAFAGYPPPFSDMSGSCPGDWLDSGVRCYYVSVSAGAYDPAVSECDSLYTGATLTTINAVSEYSFLEGHTYVTSNKNIITWHWGVAQSV